MQTLPLCETRSPPCWMLCSLVCMRVPNSSDIRMCALPALFPAWPAGTGLFLEEPPISLTTNPNFTA